MEKFGGLEIRENVPLAGFTTWKIGGPARYFAEADSSGVAPLLAWAAQSRVPVCVLGAGSNVLVPDCGVDGLVLRMRPGPDCVRFGDGFVEADAGTPLGRLVGAVSDAGFSGFEFLAGIPGSVGGAVFMNAGTGGPEGREICDIFCGAVLISPEGKTRAAGLSDMGFGHRASALQKGGDILLSARFSTVSRADPEEIRASVRAAVSSRRAREPENRRTAGSVFKSAGGVPAGWYIERAGLKGKRVGGAVVSFKHANWIENAGEATAEDVLCLISAVKSEVFSMFGVRLETEVRILRPRAGR